MSCFAHLIKVFTTLVDASLLLRFLRNQKLDTQHIIH